MRIKSATKQGYVEAHEGDGVDVSARQQNHRGNVQEGSHNTNDRVWRSSCL